ncbi:5733d91e-9488-4084-996a-322bc2f33906 [Sclerotinia trifoliorum]|uniref:5733d91e-9488-4084-996a-322bc2f33906 n=1 Tax=Sclerotinia trifoliorum TaxID=28548 RepID=A0A8H2ZVL4_9HELO|nr:5733d91e-9488-4084-996a-322bc2f33906 [Sclerotinia trifoliorum]
MNLTSTTINMNLIEYFILKCNIPPQSIIIISHYTIQIKMYKYTIGKLRTEYPDHDFTKVHIHTTDSIQEGSADIVFEDPIRTQSPGFTNDPGRNSVMLTHTTSFQIITTNSRDIQCPGRDQPIIRQAFDAAKRSKACIRIARDMEEHEKLLCHRYVETQGARIDGVITLR